MELRGDVGVRGSSWSEVRLGLKAGLGCDAELMLEVWVVLQLGLCWRLASDNGGALLEFNGCVVGGGLG